MQRANHKAGCVPSAFQYVTLKTSSVRHAASQPSREYCMTFSIIARCPRNGQFGIGIASYSIAIGRYCDGAVRANTGVTLTLGNPLPRNNYLAINLLAQGRTAGQALTELIANDGQCIPPDRARRP